MGRSRTPPTINLSTWWETSCNSFISRIRTLYTAYAPNQLEMSVIALVKRRSSLWFRQFRLRNVRMVVLCNHSLGCPHDPHGLGVGGDVSVRIWCSIFDGFSFGISTMLNRTSKPFVFVNSSFRHIKLETELKSMAWKINADDLLYQNPQYG